MVKIMEGEELDVKLKPHGQELAVSDNLRANGCNLTTKRDIDISHRISAAHMETIMGTLVLGKPN